MSTTENRTLVVFADDWGRHPSSCQHLVRRLQQDWRILWVNTIGTRSVRMDGFTFRRGWEKLQGWSAGLKQVADQMWVLDPPMLPMVNNAFARTLNGWLVTREIQRTMRRLEMSEPVVLTTLPYTAWLLGDIGQSGLVYNCTDDYSYWPSADREMLQRAESQICKQADLVLAASRQLEQLHARARRCMYFPHAVDFEHFASAGKQPPVGPLASIPSPRVGFFGLIYEKIDFELLKSIVTQHNDVQLVLIGPCDYCPSDFAALPRVHFVGKQAYENLPQWIAGLDVLLMPYVDDPMIRRSNPLKLRECLATGKPTITIDIPEVRRLEPHVCVARSREEFVAAVRHAIDFPENGSTLARRQQAVKNDSWDARARELSGYLRELASKTTRRNG